MSMNEPAAHDDSNRIAEGRFNIPHRYGVLRILKWVLRGLALLTVTGTLWGVNFLYHPLQQSLGNPMTGMPSILLTAYGVLIAVSLLAVGESIGVAIDIEHNTRLTGLLLEKMMERMEK